MRAMSDAELTQAILGNVKVTSAGMAQATAKMKKQGRASKTDDARSHQNE